MTIHIRSERIADYHRIAEINALAFDYFLDLPLSTTYVVEFILVDVLRHGATFDPELSLVAEVDGEVVGHALFYPFQVFVGGEPLQAVSLGPIAVDPARQRQGIGTALIHEGHRRARQKGHVFSFLLGHPDYYPRFGYVTNLFGQCHLEVDRKAIPERGGELEERLVSPTDVAWLVELWHTWFADADLAIFPGTSLLDWITHARGIKSVVATRGGEAIGYVRYEQANPANVKLFLATDRPSSLALLGHLNGRAPAAEPSIRLPLHPNGRAVQAYLDLPYESVSQTWDAAMIKVLDPENEPIAAYCHQVRDGRRAPGLVIYPPCIELAA